MWSVLGTDVIGAGSVTIVAGCGPRRWPSLSRAHPVPADAVGGGSDAPGTHWFQYAELPAEASAEGSTAQQGWVSPADPSLSGFISPPLRGANLAVVMIVIDGAETPFDPFDTYRRERILGRLGDQLVGYGVNASDSVLEIFYVVPHDFAP